MKKLLGSHGGDCDHVGIFATSCLQYGTFLYERLVFTVAHLVQELSRYLRRCVTKPLYLSRYSPRRRFPFANSPEITSFGSLLSFIWVMCPAQRNWEAVRMASMLDILACLKKSYVLFDQYFKQCIQYAHVKSLRTNTNIQNHGKHGNNV